MDERQRFLHYVLHIIICLLLFTTTVLGASPEPRKTRIVVGGDHNNPPYEYLENGKPTGFNVELMQAAAEVLGLDVEIRLSPWHEARKALEQKKIDALTGMYYAPERRKLVEFSVAHTMVSPAIFVRQDSLIRSLDDIQGKEVIVQEGDIIHDSLRRKGIASRLVTVTDPEDALKLLAAGKHDCAFMSSQLQGEYFIRKLKLSGLRIVNPGLPPFRYCFAVSRGNPELHYRLDEGLNILRETGKYRDIYEKWFGVYEKKAWWETIRYFVFALAAIVLLLLASLAWSRSLNRKVRRRTGELRKSQEDLLTAHAELENRVKERTSELFYSRQMLQLVLDHIPQRVFWKDRDLIYVGCNTPFAQDSGLLLPERLPGKSDFEMAWSDTAELYRADDRQVITTGQPKINYEEPQSKADGSISWLRTTKVPLRDKDGQIIGVLGMYEDITEQKKAEEALRESEGKYHAIVDAFDGHIYICSHDLRIEFMNKSLIERTGYDATGKLCYEVLHDRDSICPWCVNEQVRKGETVRWEIKSPKDDRWYYVVNTPLYRTDGTISKQAMILDITERKSAEEALRESEERYRNFVNNINLGVFMATFDHPGRFLQINQAMVDLCGFDSKEEMLNTTVAQWYQNPDDRLKLMAELKKNGFVKGKEVLLKKKNGTTGWASLSLSLQRDRNGNIAWTNGILEDITQRKRSEELLMQKTVELERSNRDLEQFASAASHDLQEPLRKIISSADLLNRRCGDKLDADGSRYMHYMVDAAKRMRMLINDLLAYSRVEADLEKIALTDFNKILEKILDDMMDRIKESGAEVIVEDLPTIPADASQMTLLFQNLIGNALKFRAGSHPRIHVSSARQETGWVFSVSDNGIGIPSEFFDRIFVMFQRLHTRDEYPGTGIGLAICKKIVERHRGRIWVESGPGKGTVFYFMIPVQDGPLPKCPEGPDRNQS